MLLIFIKYTKGLKYLYISTFNRKIERDEKFRRGIETTCLNSKIAFP